MRNFIMSGLASAIILGSAFGVQAQALTAEAVAAACGAGDCAPELAALAEQTAAAGGSVDAVIRSVVARVAEIAPTRVAATVAVASEIPGVSAATQADLSRVAEAAAAAGPDVRTAAGPAAAGAGDTDTDNNADSNSSGNTIPQIAASTN